MTISKISAQVIINGPILKMYKEIFNKSIHDYLPGSEKNIAKLLEYPELVRVKK